MFPKNSAFTPTAEQVERQEQLRKQALNPKQHEFSSEAAKKLDVDATLYILRTASSRIEDEEARQHIEEAIRLVEDSR